MIFIILGSIITIFFIAFLLYWRFYLFLRDPERKIPEGDNIVSAADGTVVYVRKLDSRLVPISIKGKKEIFLNEIIKSDIDTSVLYYIIGVFMHPTSIHVNRAPIDGIVKKIIYTKGNNLPMTLMWWRVLLGMKPYELYSNHVLQNERNTILIEGKIPVHVVQIADIYVNKIDCWVKVGEGVKKGQRIGMIKMGSQVDIIFPAQANIEIIAKEGGKVKAGESTLAVIK